MLSVGFEPTISAGERPQNYAFDRAATETGNYAPKWNKNGILERYIQGEGKIW